MKILILVLSYDDNEIYSKFTQTQKETWNSNSVDEVDTYFYFGNSNENFIESDHIYVKIEENLDNCTAKTIEAFEQIKHLEFDYLFRTNSSSYVDKSLIKVFLKDKPTDKFYCGILGFSDDVIFCSGCGYFLSKDLFNLLLEKKNELNYKLIDDVSFGKFMTDNGISPINSNRFDIYDINDTPINYFHYRLKTNDRNHDINNMKILHKKKCQL